MLIRKVLETRLDIVNANDMFCANYGNKILDMLKLRFIKKCFKSIYIIDVVSILRRGNISCKSKALDGSTYIDVTFEVDGIIYEKGEVIHGCKIIQINNNGTMHAKSEYASIYIKNTKELADSLVFKEGDVIPVITTLSRYQIYDSEISIAALPFIPIQKKSIIFHIVESTDTSDIFDMDSIKNLEKQISDVKNKAIYKFFRELLYPFKKYKKDIDSKFKRSLLKDISSIKSGDYVYLPINYLDDESFIICNQKEVKTLEALIPSTVLEIPLNILSLEICITYKKNLLQLLGFLQNYDTMEKIKQNTNIWSLYDALRS